MISAFIGETDWKILVIDIHDDKASDLNGKYIFPCTKYSCMFHLT